MMLISITLDNGSMAYVNPDKIISIEPYCPSRGSFIVNMEGGCNEITTELPSDLAQRIKAATSQKAE